MKRLNSGDQIQSNNKAEGAEDEEMNAAENGGDGKEACDVKNGADEDQEERRKTSPTAASNSIEDKYPNLLRFFSYQQRNNQTGSSQKADGGVGADDPEMGEDAFSKLQEDAAMVPSDNPDRTEQLDKLMIDAVTKIFQKTYR